LAARIRSAGRECILIGDNRLEIGRTLAQVEAPNTGIIDLRCLDAAEGSAEQPCLALVNLVQEVARINRPGVTVWSVTRGAQATGRETSPVLPWQAPAWALGRTVVSEHAEFWGGMVDLDPAAASAESADFLWRHLAAFDGEDQSAFRNGRRLVARLQRYLPPPAENPEFHADAAYLITGGYHEVSGVRCGQKIPAAEPFRPSANWRELAPPFKPRPWMSETRKVCKDSFSPTKMKVGRPFEG
jgi:hypothetical protein